jgi:surface carbohydrate biosynthesis protein
VFLGESDTIFRAMKLQRGGLFIGKNIFQKNASQETGERLNLLRRNNIRIIFLHEEGLVYEGDASDHLKAICLQFNTDFFLERDYICYWGQYTKDLDIRECKGRRVVTGHPRFSVLKESYRPSAGTGSALKRRFILICGRYGVVAFKRGYNDDWLVGILCNSLAERAPDYLAYNLESYASLISGLSSLIEIASLNDLDVVYRPHPDLESAHLISELFKEKRNFRVDNQTLLQDQLLEAVLVVQEGCTTTIDAICANVPVVSFRSSNSVWANPILKPLSDSFASMSDLLRYLKLHQNDLLSLCEKLKRTIDPKKKQLEFLINDFANDSFEALLSICDEVRRSERYSIFSGGGSVIKLLILYFIHEIFIQIKKIFLYSIAKNKRLRFRDARARFDRFNLEDLLQRTKEFNSLSKKSVRIVFFSRKLLIIE